MSERALTRLPTDTGPFTAIGYRDGLGTEHIALVHGRIRRHGGLVRVHSECLTGDVFGSLRCDCGPQLQRAMRLIVAEGGGVIVYLRGHEGRGIGLVNKLKAYGRQDEGLDTVDANLALGLPVDARDYGPAVSILHDLGVLSLRLLTNNPDKTGALEAAGLQVVERVPLLVAPGPDNHRYLHTKAARLGHIMGTAEADRLGREVSARGR